MRGGPLEANSAPVYLDIERENRRANHRRDSHLARRKKPSIKKTANSPVRWLALHRR
jgi:hypothetical protein